MTPGPPRRAKLEPSPWVTRFAPLAKRGGRALDLAAGNGRHARYLRHAGFAVTAVDRNTAEGIDIVEADLEKSGGWQPIAGAYDLIVVTNYLFRPLFPSLAEALDTGGVLLYETFMEGNEAFGHPRNPDFLLRRDELFTAFDPLLSVIAFEQGRTDRPRPAVVQRLCAVNAPASETTIPLR